MTYCMTYDMYVMYVMCTHVVHIYHDPCTVVHEAIVVVLILKKHTSYITVHDMYTDMYVCERSCNNVNVCIFVYMFFLACGMYFILEIFSTVHFNCLLNKFLPIGDSFVSQTI
jgi:hypothetical protein